MRVERIQSNSRSLLRSCALFVKVDVKGDTSFHIGLTGFYGRMQANDTSSPAHKHVQLLLTHQNFSLLSQEWRENVFSYVEPLQAKQNN